MTFADSTLVWQRWLLVAMLFGSAVIILPAAVDPFMLPKATFLVALAVALAGLGVARALWARSFQLPVSAVSVAAGAFALALITTTVTSPTLLASVIGFYSRYTGLVPYLAYLLVFVVVLRVADAGFLRLLTRTALVALGFVLGYGLLQAAGVDPLGFPDRGIGTTFSFLGNVDFSAAWAGCVVALCLAVALCRTEATGWRWYAAVLLVPTTVYLVVTGTVQGPVTAAVAAVTTVAVLASGPTTRLGGVLARHPRRTAAVAAAAAVVGASAGALALVSFRSQLERALVDRPEFWAAARDIFVDHPIIGTGLDTYAHHFLAYRPTSLALSDGADTTDAPHSVLLGMFSNGGLLLGLSYVAVVVLVGVALLRGIRDVSGPARTPFAGFAGVWVGYQAQSFVSFDVPPLALLHWLSAGVIVALAAPPRWRAIPLPGQPASRPVNRKGKTYGAYAVPTSTRILQGAVVVVALAALWLAAYPLRADLVTGSAEPLANSGQVDEAVDRFQRAAALNPAEASYPFLAARGLEAVDRPEGAFRAAAEAARRDPGTVQYALFAGRQARRAGLEEEAERWYRNAVARDPNDPPVLNEVAAFFLDTGQPEEAEELASRSLSLREDVDVLLQLLVPASEGLGDVQAARAAYQRVLELEPDNEVAAERLAALEDQR
jgi:putative inorganic carbon (HCO3(-)) transporter